VLTRLPVELFDVGSRGVGPQEGVVKELRNVQRQRGWRGGYRLALGAFLLESTVVRPNGFLQVLHGRIVHGSLAGAT